MWAQPPDHSLCPQAVELPAFKASGRAPTSGVSLCPSPHCARIFESDLRSNHSSPCTIYRPSSHSAPWRGPEAPPHPPLAHWAPSVTMQGRGHLASSQWGPPSQSWCSRRGSEHKARLPRALLPLCPSLGPLTPGLLASPPSCPHPNTSGSERPSKPSEGPLLSSKASVSPRNS